MEVCTSQRAVIYYFSIIVKKIRASYRLVVVVATFSLLGLLISNNRSFTDVAVQTTKIERDTDTVGNHNNVNTAFGNGTDTAWNHRNAKTKNETSTERVLDLSEVAKLKAKGSASAEIRYQSKYLQQLSFTSSENGGIFIFGAVVRNSSGNTQWDVCNIYGEWYNEMFPEVNTRCCFRFDDETIIETKIALFSKTVQNNFGVKLKPWYITCKVPETRETGVKLESVSIVRGANTCTDNSTRFVRPLHIMAQPPGYLVITTKTAHEQLDPVQIVSQFELFRYLGVDKVVMYVEDTLWHKAVKVFDYYASMGFVDMYGYKLADYNRLPRKIIDQTFQIYIDQNVIMRDSAERYGGAAYYGSMDYDEFVTPSGNKTLKGVLKQLDAEYPQASSYVFQNQHFFTNKKSTSCTKDCLVFNQYFYTSPLGLNTKHRKMINHQPRVSIGTMTAHNIVPKSGFKEVICPESLVTMRHYGSCERKFGKECLNPDKWVYDNSAETWFEGKVAEKIRSTLRKLQVW